MMATPWAPDPWAMKVYGRRPVPALTHAPAAAPLPPARDLEAFLRRMREHGPEAVRELRACAGELRGLAAEGRAIGTQLMWAMWARHYQRATTFGGVVYAIISSGKPTSERAVLTAHGCQVPSGLIPVWREHNADQVIGVARTFTDGQRVYAVIALADDDRGRQAAEDCRRRALWGCSAGYAVTKRELRCHGFFECLTEWSVFEISLTANPKDPRCRAVAPAHPVYDEVIRAIGFPTKEEKP